MELTHSIYQGQVFHIEALVLSSGSAPAEEWLDSQSLRQQQKFAALFALLADAGKLWNERKFKHLEGSDQIFEFKVDEGRVLCFFFHWSTGDFNPRLCQEVAQDPEGRNCAS